MANYTMLGKKDIEALMAQYGINDIFDFCVLDGGAGNSSFTVYTHEGPFVLTICDEKKHVDIRRLIHLLDYLEQENFPTTRSVRLKTGGSITFYNRIPVFLKRFIEGEVVDEFDEDMLIQLGKTLARLHEIPAPGYLPKTFPYGMDFFSDVMSSGPNHEYSTWLKQKHELLTATISPHLPRGLIHGDVFYDNVLFASDNKLAAIIDFEEACEYYTIFDVGMCMIGTCSHEGMISFAKAKSFLDGYQSKRKLGEGEQNSLQIFAEYGAIATSFWRFRQHHMKKPNANRADSFLEIKMLADHIHSLPGDTFRKRLF